MRDAWLLGAALCAMSCGSNEASEPGPQPCDGDPASGVCVLRVTGSLVDFAGGPVESAPVSVCGVEDVTAGPVGSQFRALAVPQSAWQQFVPAETAALALYALAPFEATFREQGAKTKAKAQLSFVNTTGLPPSAAVEVMILGSYYVEQSLPPGTFGPAALGHVSVDGTRIMLDDGEGVEYLSWLALREKK